MEYGESQWQRGQNIAMAKPKKQQELENKLIEITQDLQRTRADFENYQKRMEQEKAKAKSAGEYGAILKLLPVIDNIERAISHLPKDLKDNKWAQSVVGLVKNLDSALESLNVKRINAKPGTEFNPDLHEAIQFDEDAKGDKEVISEELRPGYTLNDHPFRHAMVKVTKK
jgi:molecular chaperone GrpE